MEESELLLPLRQLLLPPDHRPVQAVLVVVQDGANSFGNLQIAAFVTEKDKKLSNLVVGLTVSEYYRYSLKCVNAASQVPLTLVREFTQPIL